MQLCYNSLLPLSKSPLLYRTVVPKLFYIAAIQHKFFVSGSHAGMNINAGPILGITGIESSHVIESSFIHAF